MALFKTIEEIRVYIPVNITTDISNILPDIEWAEKKFIIPLISQAEYDLLNDEYNEAVPALTAAQERLLKYCQMPLINFAYSMNLIINQVQIDNTGIAIVSDERRKTAFQWQIEELKEDYCLQKAWDGVDSLLTMMEENKSDYPDWASSSAYTETKQFFINSTDRFQQIVDINKSRLTFVTMWPIMRAVEELTIVANISQEFYDSLKAKILAGTLTAEESTLVNKYIQPVVAFLTSSEVPMQLPVRMKHGTLTVDFISASSQNDKDRKRPVLDWMSSFSETQKAKGNNYLGRMLDYLNSNASATVFADFYNSNKYKGPDKREVTFANDKDRSTFMM